MRRLALPCAILLALAACGGGDDEGGGGSATVPADGTLRVEANEYSFDPERVVVQGGGRLTIQLDNAGDLAHNLRLERDGQEVGGTPTFGGGEQRSGRVRVQPGTYEMICTVGDHAELGMRGELEVK